MGSEMTFLPWSGNRLQGVVAWASAGTIMWFLAAALAGSVLGMLRSLESRPQGAPVAPRLRPRTGRPPLTRHAAPAVL
jgi:hypothetical protein